MYPQSWQFLILVSSSSSILILFVCVFWQFDCECIFRFITIIIFAISWTDFEKAAHKIFLEFIEEFQFW